MENEYIQAIQKLDELEDVELLEHIANHFKAKADCMNEYDRFIKEIEKEKT